MIGFEPTTFTLATCSPTVTKSPKDSGIRDPEKGGAAHIAARCTETDPVLAKVTETWPHLPDHVRETIRMLVESVR